MISQANINDATPMGANLVGGGATFRVWAPDAHEVYINGTFGGNSSWQQVPSQLMSKQANGHWTGFVDGARDGDPYKFYVIGDGSHGYKRDPYARELAVDVPFPHCNCIIRDPAPYPWHDEDFATPDYSNTIIYQLHVGTYAPRSGAATSTFLDVIGKIEYLAALGINCLQPLPIDEFETSFSLGYNGADYFSPEMAYGVYDPEVLNAYLNTVNRLLSARNQGALSLRDLTGAANQLRAMIDLCHLYGIAVVLDVVYNHAGGFEGDDESLFFWDRAANGNNNNSLYFTDQSWAGGLAFALWKGDVRQFLINNAVYYVNEFHVDGFRYDEVSVLVAKNATTGWSFCQDLTGTDRFLKPRMLQNAEFWPVNPAIVQPRDQQGAGFDVTQHDGLRDSLRDAISQAAEGRDAVVGLDRVASELYPPGFPQAWQAVTCIENHDLVKAGQKPRIAELADASNHRSWYACSRARVASGLLMTAPGIPMLFMGQEFLEDKQWSDDPNSGHLIYWDGLSRGDKPMVDFLRFTQDLIRLRWRQPALRGQQIRVFHVHNENRVIAFHRWIEGAGHDVVVVASLNENTFPDYRIGFPGGGRWLEVFNSDVYQNWVNPAVAGNGGAVDATEGPLHGFAASCPVVVPANAIVVFARDPGA